MIFPIITLFKLLSLLRQQKKMNIKNLNKSKNKEQNTYYVFYSTSDISSSNIKFILDEEDYYDKIDSIKTDHSYYASDNYF